MDLAGWMIVATIAAFTVGALFALAWSITAGQWRNLNEGARLVLEDEDPEPVSRVAPPPGGHPISPGNGVSY